MACTIAGAARAATQLDQNFPGLEGGVGAFPDGADPRVSAVDLLLPTGKLRPVAVALERGSDTAAGALVRLVGERHHVRAAQRVDDAVPTSGLVGARMPRGGRRLTDACNTILDVMWDPVASEALVRSLLPALREAKGESETTFGTVARNKRFGEDYRRLLLEAGTSEREQQ
jgi:hypothetical protein